LVLAALLAAGTTDLRAKLANLSREFAVSSHKAGRQTANCRAVHVERDALRHHLHVLLLQAGSGTTVAGVSTFIAGVDARLVNLMRHKAPPRFGGT